MMMENISARPLHLQVKQALWEAITHGEYAAAKMLPPEAELCVRFGVSRSTLRHAVTSLEQEGYLRRRQGLGTIIDRNVSSIRTRIDLKHEFSDLLARAGYVPEVRLIEARDVVAGEQEARLLQIEQGTPLLSVTKLWLADHKPAILCTDNIPKRLIVRPYNEDILHQDIFTVLRELCIQEIDYQIATLSPFSGDARVGQTLGIAAEVPIIHMAGAGYNSSAEPVICNDEWYAPGILTFTLLRARA